MKGIAVFLKELFLAPKTTGAAIPSSKYLAKAMADSICRYEKGIIVEVGPGTGVVTEALLARGVPPKQLVLIELSENLYQHCKERFPDCTVLKGDASDLQNLTANIEKPVSVIVSSLPLLNLPEEELEAIVDEFANSLNPGGCFIQFTYRWFHVLPAVLKRFKRISKKHIWANLPPARVDVFKHN